MSSNVGWTGLGWFLVLRESCCFPWWSVLRLETSINPVGQIAPKMFLLQCSARICAGGDFWQMSALHKTLVSALI